MPLIKTGTEKSVGENIAIEKHAHPDMPQKQAIAIAENTKREANKDELHEVEGVKHCVNDDPGHSVPFGGKDPLSARSGAKTIDFGYSDDTEKHSTLPVNVSLATIQKKNEDFWKHDISDPGNTNAPIIPVAPTR